MDLLVLDAGEDIPSSGWLNWDPDPLVRCRQILVDFRFPLRDLSEIVFVVCYYLRRYISLDDSVMA